MVMRLTRRVSSSARWRTARWRDLPDFLVIGAMKAATTSLHDYLAETPGLAAAHRKEIGYFDSRYLAGEHWYRSNFGLRILVRGRRSFESSPSYIESESACQRIAADLPDAKLIVLLRSPADRARSHFLMVQRGGWEQRTMREAIEQEVVHFHSARRRSDSMPGTERYQGRRYVGYGLYADRLEALVEAGVRLPILVLFMESLTADPGPSLQLLHEYLEIPPPSSTAFPHLSPVGPARTVAEDDEDLVVDELRRYFLPENRRLAELLRTRRDCFVCLPELTWPAWVLGTLEQG